MFVVDNKERIKGTQIEIPMDGGYGIIHYYIRFIGQGTELWIFGSGLGEHTLAQQLGDSFLSIVDKGEDPQLGRIMLSLGYSQAAIRPYRGDINIVWAYGITPNELDTKLNEFVGITPDVVLSPHKAMRDKAIELGKEAYHIHPGVGRFFYPMGKPRTMIGFAGVDNKTQRQKHIVLGPAIERGDLDWRSRDSVHTMSIEELNEFYNTLKVTFGMVTEDRHNIDYMPSRIFETLVTETPIITYKLHNFKKNMGFDYPYQTTSYEETKEHMDYILDNPEPVMEEMKIYSKYIRENHCYEKKLLTLFQELTR